MSDNSGASAPAGDSAPAASSESSDSEVSNQGGDNSSPEGIEQAVANGDLSSKEAKQLIKQYELKVRGKTVSKSIDLNDDNYIRDQLQLAETSRLSMQESAEIRKAYQSEMARFKSDPWSFMEENGMNPDELAEIRIQQRIEEMKKSPAQLEKEKMMKALEEAQAKTKKLEEEKEHLELSKLQEQALTGLTNEIQKAIAVHKTLPDSPYVQKRIADSMLWAMNNGFGDVTAEDVVPLVEKELRDELNKFMDVMPEEVMESYIGKKNIDRLRKRRITNAGAPVPSVNDVKPTVNAARADEDSKKKSAEQKVAARDFFRNLGK